MFHTALQIRLHNSRGSPQMLPLRFSVSIPTAPALAPAYGPPMASLFGRDFPLRASEGCLIIARWHWNRRRQLRAWILGACPTCVVYRCIQVQRGTITCNVRFRRHPFSTIFKTSHFHLAIFIWPFSSGHFHLDSRMHYHLEPVGGIAGDMFAAAMLDQHRDWQDELATAIADSALADGLAVRALTHTDGLLSGHRFLVTEPTAADQEAHAHRHWSEIRELLLGSRLEQAVMRRAIAIFELLARAEAEVHGMPVEAISFHEVGAWDSIADIVSAAWLIERSGATSWSCSSIPLGRGRIEGAHGQLPVPAPATAALLRGFPVFDDGLDGSALRQPARLS
mgnify:CR=1 FL=1